MNDTKNREIIVEREFEFSRELIWKAFTYPERLVEWWGPYGFTNITRTVDIRPGGHWNFVMTSKQGDHYHNLITYEELDHPDRIVYTHGTGDEGDTTEFRVTITLERIGSKKTKVIMHMVFQTPEALAEVKKFGAVEGANQTLDKLMVHLSKQN